MNHLTIDEETRSKLGPPKSETELRDDQGNIVGYFVCPEIYWSHFFAWQKHEEDYLDELERLAQDKDVGTLQELWKELGVE